MKKNRYRNYYFYICEDCKEMYTSRFDHLKSRVSPLCNKCLAKKLAKNIRIKVKPENISRSFRNRMLSKYSLYYGLYNLGLDDNEINEILGNKGFTYWRIRFNLEPNIKDVANRNINGTWKEGSNKGELNPLWNGGSSFEPYTQEFNVHLKKKIRQRDNHTCQECNFTEKELGETLSVHHIDYNKKNCDENNLISLCKSCHTKTIFNRKDWTRYYSSKLGVI